MLSANEIKQSADNINKNLNLLEDFIRNNDIQAFNTLSNDTTNKKYKIAAFLGTISGLTIVLLEHLLFR